MKKENFFTKIINYIKNQAWLAPILIVVVVFVILFSLSPITSGIKTLWAKVTTVNKMEKITYQEYVEKVEAQAADENAEDFVIVFTRNGCEYCPSFYKSMNSYLKSSSYKSAGFKVYNVDVSLKSSKKKIDGVKFSVYKDKTLGVLSRVSETSEKILALDSLQQLDKRLQEYYTYDSAELEAVSDSAYTYVSTPLIIWYSNGLEQRVSNTFSNDSNLSWETNKSGEKTKATDLSFRKYIQDFHKDNEGEWNNPFDLKYNEEKI